MVRSRLGRRLFQPRTRQFDRQADSRATEVRPVWFQSAPAPHLLGAPLVYHGTAQGTATSAARNPRRLLPMSGQFPPRAADRQY